MPLIRAQYIDTGLVYFVYRDLPLSDIHPSAVLASHVAGCAAEQGAFWPMHDRLFAGTSAREWGGGPDADYGRFLSYADELGLDRATLDSCVRSNRTAAAIEADVRDASGQLLGSTPSFLINGQKFIGAQPFRSFKATLDAILAGR
jgi:protein-disulfide isomerase